jgi:hypothetical protein
LGLPISQLTNYHYIPIELQFPEHGQQIGSIQVAFTWNEQWRQTWPPAAE